MSTDIKDDLRQHVSAGDVLAAVRQVHGDLATLNHWEVRPATASVQGFTSLMLRVTAHVTLPPGNTAHVTEQPGNTVNVTEKPGNTVTTSLIVKRLPVMQAQLDVMSDCEMFEREVAYFTQVLPILHEKELNLPVVKCLVAHGTTILMEDLCDSGYVTLGKSMKDVAKGMLELSHARLAVRKLAQLHAASLDVDWCSLMPEMLTLDPLFESHASAIFKNMVISGCKTASIVMKELYPEKCQKYTDWLLDDVCYDTMTKLSKPDPNFLNVLSHGDCWVNNMMFKLDPNTEQPIDMKFIDLQIFRFAPPSRDILYFLYSCTSREFRKRHEHEILRTYVDAFNAAVCKTPDRLSGAEFLAEYERSRMFGIAIAVVMRPTLFMDGMFPDDDEKFSESHFENMMFADHSVHAAQQFKENEEFRVNITELVEEIIDVMDQSGLV